MNKSKLRLFIKEEIEEIFTNEEEDVVDCPLCDGTAESIYTGNPCPHCNETGKIPRESADSLENITRNIIKKVANNASKRKTD